MMKENAVQRLVSTIINVNTMWIYALQEYSIPMCLAWQRMMAESLAILFAKHSETNPMTTAPLKALRRRGVRKAYG